MKRLLLWRTKVNNLNAYLRNGEGILNIIWIKDIIVYEGEFKFDKLLDF